MNNLNFPAPQLNQIAYMPKTKQGDVPKQIGIRTTPELRRELEQARDATGSDITELVLECVKLSLPTVVQKIIGRRQKDANIFLKDRRAA